jgi:diguanylate cyclase (GGDEF)-like protein/PAS domain S-box-containing protein
MLRRIAQCGAGNSCRAKHHHTLFDTEQNNARVLVGVRSLDIRRSDMSHRRILLIQHDSVNSKRVRVALSHTDEGSFLVEWAGSCADGLERLAKEEEKTADRIVAILAELFLPDSQGIETFDRLFAAAPHIPILVLTASEHTDSAKLAVQHGGQDYLLKERVDSYWLSKALGSMLERAAIAEVLFEEKERAQVTLDSIGDAVMSSDINGNVTYLNLAAEHLTGWMRADASGRPLEEVFHIIDAVTRKGVLNPMASAIRENKTVFLAGNCLLVRRDGVEASIEDSAAPIHDRRGRVTGAVMVFHDVSVTRALSLRMSHLAHHDNVTDLPNRVLLNDRLTHAISLAHRHRQRLAVLFLDIDRFKHVNDSLGHNVGDHLLRSVARRLLTCVRTSDTVSRQGGDEFVILLSDVTHAQDAAVIAAKVLSTLAAPHFIDQHKLHLTSSIGIVIYPDDGADSETLLKHADFAMYHAKDKGRNNYQFFEPDMNARALERQSLEGELRRAMERDEFVLHYQPKINLRTGAITGVEALIRWHHPDRGLVPPTRFVPIAEECGAIVSIGRWVLRDACRQARVWQSESLPPICISVNISTVELRHKDFIAGVGAALMESGLAPSNLELELTETFLMQDSQSTAIVLQALKKLGVRLALDDFGTGFSSMSHLKNFPIDTLKIDQSFVRNLTTDAGDAGIVTALIGMGRSLGMGVVAEGVETVEQLAHLREQGCPEGQGNHFSRPLSAENLTRLLKCNIVETYSPDGRSNSESVLKHVAVGVSDAAPQASGRRVSPE